MDSQPWRDSNVENGDSKWNYLATFAVKFWDLCSISVYRVSIMLQLYDKHMLNLVIITSFYEIVDAISSFLFGVVTWVVRQFSPMPVFLLPFFLFLFFSLWSFSPSGWSSLEPGENLRSSWEARCRCSLQSWFNPPFKWLFWQLMGWEAQ